MRGRRRDDFVHKKKGGNFLTLLFRLFVSGLPAKNSVKKPTGFFSLLPCGASDEAL